MRQEQTVLCGYGVKSAERLEEEQVQAEQNELGLGKGLMSWGDG